MACFQGIQWLSPSQKDVGSFLSCFAMFTCWLFPSGVAPDGSQRAASVLAVTHTLIGGAEKRDLSFLHRCLSIRKTFSKASQKTSPVSQTRTALNGPYSNWWWDGFSLQLRLIKRVSSLSFAGESPACLDSGKMVAHRVNWTKWISASKRGRCVRAGG